MFPFLSRSFSTANKRGIEAFCSDLSSRGLVDTAYPGTLLTDGIFLVLFYCFKEFLFLGTLKTNPNVCYAGFDPTAESLHVGNLVILSSLLRAATHGLKTFALVGGATALIGDPSGKQNGNNFCCLFTIFNL